MVKKIDQYSQEGRTKVKKGKRTTVSVDTDGKKKSVSVKGPDTLETDLKGTRADTVLAPAVEGVKNLAHAGSEAIKATKDTAEDIYHAGKGLYEKGKKYVQSKVKQGSEKIKTYKNTPTDTKKTKNIIYRDPMQKRVKKQGSSVRKYHNNTYKEGE